MIKATNADNYYDIGNETLATQIYKLFNLKTRSELEQLILWDFHCLKENEKVTRKELKTWMGYDPKDFDKLVNEGWITFQDNLFFIHPLVNQAISCSEQDWAKYWKWSEYRRQQEKTPSLVTLVKTHNLFMNSDTFDTKMRKMYLANYLSYEGRFLEPEELIYLADNARRIGARELGLKFYKATYDKLTVAIHEQHIIYPQPKGDGNIHLLLLACCDSFPFISNDYDKFVNPSSEQIKLLKLFWKCCYFYGYMLSYTPVGMQEARDYMSLSMIIIRQLQMYYNDEEYMNNYGRTLDHLAYVISQSDMHNPDVLSIAYNFYSEALEYRQKLVTKHPANMEYQRNLAWTMDNLGVFLTDFLTEDEYISNHKDFYLNPSCFETGENHPEVKQRTEFLKKNLQDAETLLQESLQIRKMVASKNGNHNSTEVAWTDVSMTKLLMNYSDKLDEAEQYILDALNIYNELDKLYPAQHASSQAKAYKIYSELLKCMNKPDDAANAYKTRL